MELSGAFEQKPEEQVLGEAVRVIVSDVDIKFWTIVHLMVKFFFAAIPAIICIYCLIIFGLSFLKGCIM